MWVEDVDRTQLGDEEDQACYRETPDAAGLQDLDEEIGSNTLKTKLVQILGMG